MKFHPLRDRLVVFHSLLVILLCCCLSMQALAESYTTNIISGITKNISGDYSVGTNGAFNALIVTNVGRLVVSGQGIIGNSATSSNNTALVSGVGSLWSNSATLYVGAGGASNRLTIANGAQVFNAQGRIGNAVSANDNAALVTGSGSLWSNSLQFYIGVSGSRNSLTISNGGEVFSPGGWIGFDPGANDNSVLVTGDGSIWRNSVDLQVGASGSRHSLIITNSGRVVNNLGFIGLTASASNNSVLVTGLGSLWSNANSLYVGYFSSSNQLTVANSGTVRASNAVIGVNAGVAGNQMTVSGGNLIVTNTSGSGSLDVRRGTLTLNSGTVTVNQLVVTNGASSVVNFNGGTLNTGASSVSNGIPFRVGDGTDTATLNLMGGTHSFFNGLIVTNNAQLTGIGTIVGDLTDRGTISPGNSAGKVTVEGRLILFSSSVLDMELGGTNAGAFDQLVINGELVAAGTLDVALIDGFSPTPGDLFRLFDFDTVSGGFTQTNLPYGLSSWNTSHMLAPSSDPLSGSLIFIPEPSASVLLMLGFVARLFLRRRR